MTTIQFQRRGFRAAMLAGLLLCFAGTASAQGIPLPRLLALAFGAGDTPTPSPIPTPTPTPTPTPEPPGPKTYRFPAENPFVSIVMPAGWTATDHTNTLVCAPDDAGTGYAALLVSVGDLAGQDARTFLSALVKQTLANAKVSGPKIHTPQTGKLSSGVGCITQVVEGKLGAVPMSYVFMCFAPVSGHYLVFMATGRSDKLNASGFDVVGAMADSVKPL